MDFFTIVALSVGLSMDSFSVSFADGVAYPAMTLKRKLGVAFIFAIIQFSFFSVGWLAGGKIISMVNQLDHWIAFALLTFISMRMIYEAREEVRVDCLNTGNIFLQGIATSIDAIIVGFSVAAVLESILPQGILIGIVTFIFSMLGFGLGKIIGQKFVKISHYIGAGFLFLIGLKILLEHLLS